MSASPRLIGALNLLANLR